MNNLKFRAWDIDMREMLEVSQITFAANCDKFEQPYILDQHNDVHYLDDVELIQFTMLKDDFGKEIFQGDIVDIQNKGETKTSYVSKVYITQYGVRVAAHPAHIKMGIVANRNLVDFCDYGFGGKYDVSCKVIGNIYENKELIES